MVSAIKNQRVERRIDPMAPKDNTGHSLRYKAERYRNSLDHEIHLHDRGLEDYARALQTLVKNKTKREEPGALSRFWQKLTKRSPDDSLSRLLRSWNDQARTTPVAKRPAQPTKIALDRGTDRKTNPSRFDLRSPQLLPVAVASFATVVFLLASLLVPGSFGSGYLATNNIGHLSVSEESRALDLRFADPLNDEKLNREASTVDTRRFQALSVQVYQVQPGDTLGGIATRFNLNIDTLISFNNITNVRAIRPGEMWKIPNRNGLMYKVRPGDSLESIAKKYTIEVLGLLDANDLASPSIAENASLFIPEARMNSTDLKLLLGELFMWPAVGGISDFFGYRADPFTGINALHNGIDIANALGTPVRAALAGQVVVVESQIGNYGKMIIIQHGGGFQTLYGHLDSFAVQPGQYVNQGQLIGRLGNSGKSTGPHCHFSVIRNGVFVNPLFYLK